MDKKEKLLHFAKEMSEGIELVKQKKDEEAIKKLSPYIQLMSESGKTHIRLFAHYGIAQIRTGDIEGYLETFRLLSEMKAETAEEKSMKEKSEQLFHQIMEQMMKG